MDVIAAVIARIQAQVPALRGVQGAMELDAVVSGQVPVDCPAAFVIPLRDTPAANELATGAQRQRVERTLGVVLALHHYRDRYGTEAVPDLQQLREQIRTALFGWVPDASNGEPIRAGTGQLIDFVNDHTWWSDQYHVYQYWSTP